jgi:Cu2+-exporting ATPase
MVSLLGKAQTPEDEKKGAAPLTVVACSLVHAIPGRVRFRVPKMARDPRFTRRLQRLIESDARVTGVRVSSAAASIAISYEINLVKDAEMHAHLVRLIQSAGVENIVETGFIRYPSPWETEKPGSLAKTEKPGFFKKPGFLKPFTGGFLSGEESEWSGLKLPALATALAVIGGPLGLPVPGIAIGATVAAAGLPVAKRAFESIRKSRRFNIDCMDLMAITLTSFQGNLLTPALVMTLHEIGDIIRDRTARSSRLQALDLLLSGALRLGGARRAKAASAGGRGESWGYGYCLSGGTDSCGWGSAAGESADRSAETYRRVSAGGARSGTNCLRFHSRARRRNLH